MASEFYIRTSMDADARGPFTVEKLSQLAEAGQITSQSLVYDEVSDNWVQIETKDELMRAIFPEVKKLGLKAKSREDVKALNQEDTAAPAITVDQMLKEAEGDTPETRHARELQKWQARAAALICPFGAAMMLLSAATFIAPVYTQVQAAFSTGDWLPLFQHPLAVLGAIDLFVALCVFIGATEIFEFMRFRAALGFGYFGVYYWALWTNSGDPQFFTLLCATLAASGGMFLVTMSLNFAFILVAGAIGIGGSAVYGFLTAGQIFFSAAPVPAP